MALIKCPECEGQVSSQAPSCPTCGHPINTAMVQQQPQQMTQHQSSSTPSAHEIGQAVADPMSRHFCYRVHGCGLEESPGSIGQDAR